VVAPSAAQATPTVGGSTSLQPQVCFTRTATPPYTPEEQKMIDTALSRLEKEADAPLQAPFDKIPPEAQPLWRWEHSHPKFPPGGWGEQTIWWAEEMEQLYRDRNGKEHVYGEMPLIVLALAPGEPARIRLSLYPTSVLLRKGHRVRVALAGADGSAFQRYPAEGIPTWTIYREAQRASFIEWPAKRNIERAR
jgi:X-Pro dipeptidyl-peptidase C-terminal non-catalytic domain